MAKKGSFNLDQEKIESHYFLLNLQIFHNGSPDFPLSGVGRSTVKKKKKKTVKLKFWLSFCSVHFRLFKLACAGTATRSGSRNVFTWRAGGCEQANSRSFPVRH